MIIEMGESFDASKGELFPTADAGIYDARVVGVAEQKSGENSKHPGTPMWRISYSIEDASSEFDGISINSFQTLPVGEGTEWMEDKDRKRRTDEIKRLWNAAGLAAEGGSIESDDLMNAQLQIVVGLEEFNGKPSNSIKDVLAI